MKKWLISSLLIMVTLSLSTVFAEGSSTQVGGHIKLNVYDYNSGEVDGTKGDQTLGLGIKEFIMYVKKELSDTLSLEVSPKLSWSTGATPKLSTSSNKKIGTQLTSPSSTDPTKVEVETLFFTMQMPDKYTARLGYFIPRFTWSYGFEKFWEEVYHGSQPMLSLMGYHDSGLEVYKEYSISKISLPTYMYVLNGNGAYGNPIGGNLQLGLNVEPEIMGIKTHAAYFFGKRDGLGNDQIRRAIGAEYQYGLFEITAEAVYNTAQNSVTSNTGAVTIKTKGYEVKAFYKVTPELKAMLSTAVADVGGLTDSTSVRYKDTTIGGIYNLSDDTLLQAQFVMADQRNYNGSKKMIFNRFVSGIRCTF